MPSGTRSNGDADLVLTGGRVLTMDPDRPVVEALAVSGGLVSAAGTADDIRVTAGFRDGNHRPRRFDRRSRVQRHARPHGPGRAESPTPRRWKAHGPFPTFSDRISKLAADCIRRGVDRHHARRHTSLLLRRAGDSGGRPQCPRVGNSIAVAPDNPVCIAGVFGELGCAARIYGSQQPCAGTQWH